MAISDLIYIDNTGFHYPDYPTVLTYYQNAYRSIYGADIYLEADSQDGEWLAIQAQSVYDSCVVFSGIYNSFSPSFAQTDALSRNVAINGITRNIPTYSTVDLYIVGTAGTVLNGAKAQDNNGIKWSIPDGTTIGVGGTITVTATCDTIGAVAAGIGSVVTIATPTRGWLTVNNPSAATEGQPFETDAELRVRQARSTMLPAQSVLNAIESAIADVAGVVDFRVYENDTNATDADGIPAHTGACAVVDGGTVQDIVDAIGNTKPPGSGTYGATSGTFTDQRGNTKTIYFYRPTDADISVDIDITALAGYNSGTEDLIKAAVAESINALLIGNDVLITRLYAPATLAGLPEGLTFNLTALQIKKNAGSFVSTDLKIAFNEVAECLVSNITITVT